MSCYAVVRDDMLPALNNRRVTVLPKGETQTTHCAQCGKSMTYGGKKQDIIAASCSHGHLISNTIPTIPKATRVETTETPKKKKKPPQCPSCGGPSTRGRGYDHADNCPESTVNRLRAQKDAANKKRQSRGNCPHCGGPPGVRRGWKHKPDCTKGKT